MPYITKKDLSTINSRLSNLENRMVKFDILTNKNKAAHCAECGVPIIINDNVYNRRLEDKGTFYCSVGHHNVFK